MAKTMSHTKEQREAWHKGKRRENETKNEFVRRIIRAGNWRGAFTPRWWKTGFLFADSIPLPHNRGGGQR